MQRQWRELENYREFIDNVISGRKIKEEVNNSKNMFKKFNWPMIDVTRRSVEETAASIIKIYEIKKNKWK